MNSLETIKQLHFERACQALAQERYGKDYRDLTDEQCAKISKEVRKLKDK